MLKVEIVYWNGNIKNEIELRRPGVVVGCNRRERVKCVYPQTILLDGIKIFFKQTYVFDDILKIYKLCDRRTYSLVSIKNRCKESQK